MFIFKSIVTADTVYDAILIATASIVRDYSMTAMAQQLVSHGEVISRIEEKHERVPVIVATALHFTASSMGMRMIVGAGTKHPVHWAVVDTPRQHGQVVATVHH
jgi:hypothetical protein